MQSIATRRFIAPARYKAKHFTHLLHDNNLKASNHFYLHQVQLSSQSRKMLSWTIALSNVFNKKKQNKLEPIGDSLLVTPAYKLSQQIREGKLKSEGLCERLIERAKLVQPHLNCITQERYDEALREARAIDLLLDEFRAGKREFSAQELELLRSPLLGVPISVKESIKVRSMRNTCGLWTRRDTYAEEDAQVVQNARRNGMIPFCVTNVPECTLFWADCSNKVYGRTVNPYDLSRIPGASSGGEGSLIGSGASLMGIGSDIGGSLRIPAHFCGIYSHKPSPFLVSPEGNYPEINEARLRMFTLGPMCRYATDLKPFLKCLMNDAGSNPKQDSYKRFQPENIGQLRDRLMDLMDEQVDLSQLKFLYFKFNECSQLKGSQSVHCLQEIMDSQQELLDHFSSKFNCQLEHISLDKYIKKTMIMWQCMLRSGGCKDRDLFFKERELEDAFGIDNLFVEFLKIPLGISKHTKESLLAVMVGATIPKDRQKAFVLCEKFEKLAQEMKLEIEQQMGDSGVLILPTIPQVAYKHNEALIRTPDIRFPALLNVLQLPVTHATMRLDKKHKLPYGFSIAAKAYNDHLTLAVAEEIELAFGGWTSPAPLGIDKLSSQNSNQNQIQNGNKQSQNQDQDTKP